MKFLQAYYTSCDVGQTGFSGFQFYSYSDGITEEELQEIRELGSYEAPFGLTVNPTQDEVLNLFPVAFKYFRLKSGRVGVLQSTACTMEYTGRPGNFFTHTLLLEQGQFAFMPVMLYKSRLFMHDLTDSQKEVKTQPPKLPVLTVNSRDDVMSESFQYFNQAFVGNFLRSESNKMLISKLLDIILGNKNQEKKIILADNKIEEIVYVLASAMPVSFMTELTFSSYSRNPDGQNVVLSGSRGEGSAFEFDSEWMQRSYYVFNKSREQYPELPDQSLFSKTAVDLLISQPEKLAGLYQFSNNFNGEKSTANLDLISGIYTHRTFRTIWKQVIGFVAESGREEYLETFINDYRQSINELPSILEKTEDYVFLLKSVHSIIKGFSGQSSWFEWLFSLYIDSISNNLNLAAKELVGLNKELAGFIISVERDLFGKYFFKDNVFLNLYSQSENDDTKLKAFTVIINTAKMLSGKLNKITNFYAVPGIRKFITAFNQGRTNISPETIQCFIKGYSDELSEVILQINQAGDISTAKWLIEQFYKNEPPVENTRQLEQALIKAGQRSLYSFSLPFYYNCRKDDPGFFAEIIEQEPQESDFEELNTYITGIFEKNNSVSISNEVFSKLLNHPKITEKTCKVVILQFDRSLLLQQLSKDDLKKISIVENRNRELLKEKDVPTINLLLSTEKLISEKKYSLLLETMTSYSNNEKAKFINYMNHYQNKILDGLLQKNDWKKIFSLSRYVSIESLQEQVSDYLANERDIEPVLSFIRFVSENKNGDREELCKKVLIGLSTGKFGKLKDAMKKETDSVADYFDSLAKKIKFKRLINFKF